MIDINELRQSLGAVTPEEVGELLDRLEAAEEERDALRAKIAEMERKEPVAWMLNCPTLGGDTGWILSWTQSGAGLCNRLSGEENEKKLYALPGAQSAQSVPEGFALVNAAHFLAVLDREDWRTAKNRAELRAMLAAAPEAKP